MKKQFAPIPLFALIPLALAVACGEPDLEVKGTLQRVVGETVTLNLLEGDNGFSGTIELIDARAISFNTSALKVNRTDARKLSFVIPAGIALGRGSARVDREDGERYVVPLEINRLVLALDNKGVIETLPLQPATLSPGVVPGVDAVGGMISLSPSGGELAVLAKDQLNMLALGAAPRAVGPGISQTGGRAITTVPDGVLVCTDSALLLVRFKQGSTSQISAAITGCKAVAADSNGMYAVVLGTCDTDSDTQDEDCLTQFKIGSSITQVAQISLDTAPGATHVAMHLDGKGAVVGDTDNVYGVWLDQVAPKKPTAVAVSWGTSASVVSIDVASSSLGDLFAVGDKAGKRIRFLGFDPKANNDLKTVFEATLPEEPVALSYGAGPLLYVSTGTKIYNLNAEQPSRAAELITTASANPTLFLAVQP